MSNTIIVNPNELDSLAAALRSQMREMDETIKNACAAVSNIGGSAKGLDGARDAARNLYRAHGARMQEGEVVTKHVVDMASAFRQVDNDMAGRVRSASGGRLTNMGLTVGGVPLGALGLGMQLGAALGWVNPSPDQVQNFLTGFNGLAATLAQQWGTTVSQITPYLKRLDQITGFINSNQIFRPGSVPALLSEALGIAGKEFGKGLGIVTSAIGMVGTIGKGAQTLYTAYKTGDWSQVRNTAVDLVGKFGTKAIRSVPFLAPIYAVSDTAVMIGNTASGFLDFVGLHDAANVTRNITKAIDLDAQTQRFVRWTTNQVIDGVSYVVANPHEAMDRATNFVSSAGSAISNAAGRLWSFATGY